MRWRTALALMVVLLVAGWSLGWPGLSGRPRQDEFRKTVAEAAQGALSAVRTAHLAGSAGLAGRLTRAFLSPVLNDADEGVATARQRLARVSPPGAGEAGTRDELMRLLADAGRATRDLVVAFGRGDESTARAVVGRLAAVGDRLAVFVEVHPP